jgi:hypothetical protein
LAGRRVDAKATKDARERHARGVAYLDWLFLLTPLGKRLLSDKFTGRPRPVRLRPGTPPLRPDTAARARRRRRKLAHAARRRNRP